MRSVCGLLAVFAGASAAAAQADDGRKIALIIAISDSGDPGLNPVTGEPMRR